MLIDAFDTSWCGRCCTQRCSHGQNLKTKTSTLKAKAWTFEAKAWTLEAKDKAWTYEANAWTYELRYVRPG